MDNISGRLHLGWRQSNWRAETDYQISWVQSDFFSIQDSGLSSIGARMNVPDDSLRALDLSDRISTSADEIAVHRLDRLAISYHSDHYVFKLGRQAISWGNGVIYNPMDFFNPFDPAVIDKEYKPGDDMFYAQRAYESGDDLQFVYVARRNAFGDIDASLATAAIKYHVFVGEWEIDVLASQHYDDAQIALGAVRGVGGAIWRGDIVSAKLDSRWHTSAVTSLSYSWVGFERNMSASFELFRNGFGVNAKTFSEASLSASPDLLARIHRGEVFTFGRDFFAANVMLEVSPLWMLNAVVFHSLGDQSSLWQLVSRHDLAENFLLTAAMSLPIGERGTEFGGIEVGAMTADDYYASTSYTLDLQLAWYF